MLQASTKPIRFPRSPAAARTLAGPLPAPATSLLGREREVDQILALLDRDDLRIVTLLGTGGVGKTRLALEVAHRIGDQFADGAAFVPLEAIRDADLVPGAVAASLGVEEQFGRHITEVLAGVLADRHMLLLLDNVEQVAAAGSWLARLLTVCPRVRILATSRVPLRIGGEQLVRVAPLPVPEGDGLPTAAVDLFVERGLMANLDLAFDEQGLRTVAAICHQLDGLPLAIELAAARLDVLAPEAILARLTDRLTLLNGDRQDVPLRLQSMRDAIAWSYELLDPAGQRLLRRLAVCLGGFSLETAAHVAAWPDRPFNEATALAMIQGLVNQSLAQVIPGSPEPRFRMLETIRQFGLDEATRAGDLEAAHQAVGAYVLWLAQVAEGPLTGPEQGVWLERLESAYPMIRAAVDWLDAQDRLDDAVAIISGIQFFFLIGGHAADVFEWVERWHDRSDLERLSRGRLLLVHGALKREMGSLQEAVTLLQAATALLRQTGDVRHESLGLSILATTFATQGDVERMRESAAKSLGLARTVGFHRPASAVLSRLADHAELQGDVDRARQLREEAFQVARSGGDVWLQAFHFHELGREAAANGAFGDAEGFVENARTLFESMGSRRDLPGVWWELALISLYRGDLDTASVRASTGLALARTCGYEWYVFNLLLVFGKISALQGELVLALDALTGAAQLLDDPREQRVDTSFCLHNLALLAVCAGDGSSAVRFLAASLRLRSGSGIDPLKLLPLDTEWKWTQGTITEVIGKNLVERADRDSEAIDIHEVFAEAKAYQLPDAAIASKTPPERPYGLSPRELEVLSLMAAGRTNQQIADELRLSLRTITSYVTGILTKLDVPSRTAAVAVALREGIA